LPALKNPKWEIVALAMADGSSQKEAVLAAKMKYDPPAASRLVRRPAIQARIAEIQHERDRTERQIAAQSVSEAAVDRAWVIRHLKHNALAAMRGHPLYDRGGNFLKDANGNPRYGKPDHAAAAVSLKLIGTDLGMFINRTELGGPGDFARMTDTELFGELRGLVEAMGLPPEMLALVEPETEDEEEE
jgi:hypothetical protein